MQTYQLILTYISLIIHSVFLLLSLKPKEKIKPLSFTLLSIVLGNLFLLYKKFYFPLFLVIQLLPVFLWKYYFVFFLIVTGQFSMTSGV